MITRCTFGAPMELKALENDGEFSGHASVFGNLDETRDIVKAGAFKRSLKEWKARKEMPPFLWQHNTHEPIGVITALKEDDIGLAIEGRFAVKTQKGAEAAELFRMKAVRGLSFGYLPVKWGYDEEGDIRILSDVDLFEVSAATIPANRNARIEDVKAALSAGQLLTEREFEDFLRDAGFSRKDAKGIVALGYRDSSRRDAVGELLESLRRRNAALIS